MSWIKRSLFFCSLFLLLFCAIFPQEIFLAGLKWRIEKYFRKAWAGSISFEKVSWVEGKIVFLGGHFHKKNSLEATFSAILQPQFSWKKWEVGGNLNVENFRIVCRKAEKISFPVQTKGTHSFLTFDLKTTISGGEIFLYDHINSSSSFQKTSFDLSYYVSAKNGFGSMTFYRDIYKPKLSSFFFKKEQGSFLVSGSFSHHPFSEIYGMLTFFLEKEERLKDWKFLQGFVEGKFDFGLEKGKPKYLKANLLLSHLKAENTALEILAHVEEIQSVIDTDFSSVSGINGLFTLQGGKLALQEKPEVCVETWDLNELHSKICVKSGRLESSVVHAQFLGMQGQLLLDCNSDTLIHMGFCGLSKEMDSFFPMPFQSCFQKAFPNDYFVLDADVKKAKEGVVLEGFLSIFDENKKQYHIDFGCHFGHDDVPDKKIELEPLPFSLSCSVSHFLEEVKDQFYLSQKRLGWFRGKQLALEKFLSPFLFKNVNMLVSGEVDVEATFDERYLMMFYEGEEFELDSPYFHLKADTVERKEAHFAAVHCIDLDSFSHVGYLPIKNATYFQKTHKILFENTLALLQFENNMIKIKEIAADWEDLKFQGSLDILINSLNDIHLDIYSEQFCGPLKNAERLISYFVPSKIWNTPVEEGVVEGFFDFKYHFSPKAELKEGFLKGHMKNGLIRNEFFQLADCGAKFEYNHSLNAVSIAEGSAHLLIPSKNKSFAVNVPCAELTEFPYFQVDFLLDVAHEGASYLNMKGKSQRNDQGREFFIVGNPFTLSGIQVKDTFNIEDFSFGPWQGSARLKMSEFFEIEHLSCRKNEKKGFTFAGSFDPGKKHLKGTIEQLQWDLNDPFEKKLSVWNPRGEISLLGTFDWKLGTCFEIRAGASFKDLEFGGIHFGSGSNVKCFYSGEHGLAVEGLEVEIPTKEGSERYKLGRFFYDHGTQKMHFEGFDFSLPCEKLSTVSKTLEMLFPSKIHSNVLDILHQLKQNEPLEGRFSLEIFPDHTWVCLNLKNGTYFLSGKKVKLSDFLLVYDPLELNIWTKCHYLENDYWIHFLTDTMTLTHGTISISEKELSLDRPENFETMCAKWEWQKGIGWHIRSVEGYFSGMDVSLKSPNKMEHTHWVDLKGQIRFDPATIGPIWQRHFNEILDKITLKGTYEFDGDIHLDKKDFKNFFLSGGISGQDIFVSGIGLDTLSCKVNYQKDSFLLSDLSIKDWAGRLTIGNLSLKRLQQDWEISIDHARLNDLRFSRLRSSLAKTDRKRKSLFRSLYIPIFSLDHMQGVLGKPESLVGSGKLEFANVPKKNLFSSLLFLPTEITARIGLDLTNLVPVKGTIIYEMKDNKIHLLELKDMFSEGKRSRFYLADSSAYVDFRGNLNLKIKMKQYNLLMKLAEFFTVSVRGTLLKPTYTFSNHLDDEENS